MKISLSLVRGEEGGQHNIIGNKCGERAMF